MRAHEPTPPPDPYPPWMLTFADVVSLVLTFFVMLFAVSELQRASWGGVSDALAGRLPATNAPVYAGTGAEYNIATVFRSRAIDLSYLEAVIAQRLAADPEMAGIDLVMAGDRLVVALPEAALFADGQDVMSEKGERTLAALGATLRNVANGIGVASRPAGRAASDYETALLRGMVVAGALRKAGYLREVAVHARPRAAAGRVEIAVFEGRTGG